MTTANLEAAIDTNARVYAEALDDDSLRRIYDALDDDDDKRSFVELMETRQRLVQENKLRDYKPYPKQLEFHNATSKWREVAFLGSNQSGKSLAGAATVAIMATGLWPSWWKGRRWDRPIRVMVLSESATLTVNGMQRLLLGDPADPKSLGTGLIPKSCIVGKPQRKSGVVNGIETISIRHASGLGNSTIRFGSYEQSPAKLQADSLDLLLLDEEADWKVYSECITRTNATKGTVITTFTPLKGKSKVVERFWPAPDPKMAHLVGFVQMGIQDVGHFSAQDRLDLLAKYPLHEHRPRLQGIPQWGTGLVFPPEPTYICNPFPIPEHFKLAGGIDFGINHESGFCKLAFDLENEQVFIVACYKAKDQLPLAHLHAVKGWGSFPWFWPHDGHAREKGSGEQLYSIYKDAGFETMWHEKATMTEKFPHGRTLEPSIMKICNAIALGKFKIFSTCQPLLEEMREYHRDDQGRIVAEKDDLISAMRYAFMMLRYAQSPIEERTNRALARNSQLSPSAMRGW